MKWKNRGHEYDELGACFQQVECIYLYGNGSRMAEYYDLLVWLGIRVKYIRQSGIEKNRTLYKLKRGIKLIKEGNAHALIDYVNGKRVNLTARQCNHGANIEYVAIDEAISTENKIVLYDSYEDVKAEQLEKKFGCIKEKTLFAVDSFMEKELIIWNAYVNKRIYSPSTGFKCIEACTLNCENCLDFVPYKKNMPRYSLDELKKSVDIYFRCIEKTGLFHVTGGEPFLYDQLPELLEYIAENYSEKIYDFVTITNGTLVPVERLLSVMKKYSIRLQVDDYRGSVPKVADNYNQLIRLLNEYEIYYQILKTSAWYKMYPPIQKNGMKQSEKEMIQKYETCNNRFTQLHKSYLFNCNYAGFASIAGLAKADETDYYDLENYDHSKLYELAEFRAGCNEKGYASFCRQCNGFQGGKVVEPGIQVKGKLEVIS